ncbi:MAG: Glycosyl transferase, family 2 [uncultured Friedmanniella sp.]|uniref:Glycosyl transferase, family 2 n=1 Tax=uncultured Friedmanniella sp. TaxID=335381 RepID=A0A6J4LCV1_9ACTN|nr:MAG: Glycosyl transferase, family 2 [uncultured Friedmanniella sp.]
MDTPTTPTVVALLPAHDEQRNISSAIRNLENQTVRPDRIIVIPNNCTDATAEIAASCGAEVRVMTGNRDKKAGALNWVLADLLVELGPDDLVLVQDADSNLDRAFLEKALPYAVSPTFGAVGGVFRGEGGAGLVGHLQRNEYTRYARDVRNLGGRCLVVTGTAAVFRVGVLREVSQARLDGRLPAGDGRGGVYDTTVLTEDNEISFAVQTLGYRLVSPLGCYLTTEIMPTWSALWHQRLRWKRGAVENCVQYGYTPTTRRYWNRQALALTGVIIFALYLSTLLVALVTGSMQILPFWLGVTLVFMVERTVTVKDAGWKQMLVSFTMYEFVLDIFLQACHATAFAQAFAQAERKW